MLRITLLSLLSSLVLLSACEPLTKAKKKPNVVFILVDDFGWADVGYNGSKFYETPNIDRIAEEGFVFTNGYASCQVCSPSRASIMTGQSPARHGITDWIGARTGEEWRAKNRFNKLLPPEYVHSLPADILTMPEAFQQGGYKTFFAGKWHIGGEGSYPEDHGFDINIGGNEKGWPAGGFFAPFYNPQLPDKVEGENLSMRLAQETVDFITEHKDSTFLAYLAFYAVHSPIQTSQDKWKKYRDKAEAMGVADSGYEMGHFFPIRQVQDNPIYAGLVESMDESVGLVLDALERLGLDENTIVVFTSDNGGVAAGDNNSTSNLPLRAGKGYQFEGGVREPYLIKVPWMQKQTIETPVNGMDFYPTLLDLAGLPLQEAHHRDGVSLKPLLEGKEIADRIMVWHYPHYGNQGGEPSSMIRDGDWKLIHYYEDGHKELYHLAEDLEEQHDLAAENPDRVADLDKKLFDYLNEVGARFPEKDPAYDAQKEAEFLRKIREERWPHLEKRRLEFLQPDYEAPDDWWGSKVID